MHAVRLTAEQSEMLRRTLINFGIKGSSRSEQLRTLLGKIYRISLKHYNKHKEIQRIQRLAWLRGEKEREEGTVKARARAAEEAEEDAEHEKWFKSLGEEEAPEQ